MRTLGILLAVTLMLGVAACGDDSSGGGNNHSVVPDASQQGDASAQLDASQQEDAATQPDAAEQVDAASQADSSTPGTGITGEGCSDPSQCGGITNGTPECLTSVMSMLNFPGGYCSSQSCTADQPCDNGTGVCVNLMLATICLKPCTSPSDCRVSEGYDCKAPPIGSTETYCLPGGGMSLDGGFGLGDGGFGLGDGGFFP